jgi:nucleoside-diphosphate-sugar epimerase
VTAKLRSLDWHPSIDLKVGLASTYEWFRNNIASLE